MTDTATIRAFLDDSHLTLAGEVDAFAAASLRTLPAPENDEAARRQAQVLLERR